MKNKTKVCIFLAAVLAINIKFGSITYTMLYDAYKPYNGVTVVLDAGHGGKDLGCEYEGINESDLNIDMVNKIKKELETIGFIVLLTRSDEHDLASEGATNRKREDLNNRVDIINQEKVDIYISVHMNAYVTNEVKGSQLFYFSENEDSKQLANHIDESIKKVSESELKVKQGDSYYILNKPKKVGVLLECAFLSNASDREKMLSEEYREHLANEVVVGIVSYLNDKHYE